MTCSAPGCNGRLFATGLCQKHYARLRRHGELEPNIRRVTVGTDEERFWAKVEKTDDCWLWKAADNGVGYGVFRLNSRQVLAHRVAYQWANGPIPVGLTLDHLCRTPRCVRPSHLEAVTQGENTLRGTSPMAMNARKTHCLRGHEFTPENTYTWNGGRECRACNRIRDARRKRRQTRRAA